MGASTSLLVSLHEGSAGGRRLLGCVAYSKRRCELHYGALLRSDNLELNLAVSLFI